MARENLIVDETFSFALRMVEMARLLREQREFDLASQFWRAGTSIGANVEEAQAAQSRPDFLSKMSIAAKEARETRYWLRLIREGNIVPSVAVLPRIEDIERILRILTSIVKTASESEHPKSRIQNPESPQRSEHSKSRIQNPESHQK